MIELLLEDASLTVADEFANARVLNRKRKAGDRIYNQRYQKKRAAKGLCISCSRPALKGARTCQRHRDLDRARCREWRERGRVSEAREGVTRTPTITSSNTPRWP